MRTLKALIRDWLPPVLVRWLRLVRGGVRFEGEFSTWDEARANCTGYDAKNILDKVLASTLKVKNGEAAFERDSVLFDAIEYTWPVVSGLMWAAARSGGKLNVLDFGGALGSSYFQNHEFLQGLHEVHWNVVEQLHYVEAGRQYIQDEQLRFYPTLEECLAENQPNVILMSSVLEYLEDPESILSALLTHPVDVLIIDRSPFSARDGDKIVRQIVLSSIFTATLPCRILSLAPLEKILSEKGMKRIATYPGIGGSGNQWSYQGYIFSRG